MAHCGGREKADVVKLVDTLDLDPSAICLRVRVSPSVRPCFNYVYLIKKTFKRFARFELAAFDFEKQCSIQLS